MKWFPVSSPKHLLLHINLNHKADTRAHRLYEKRACNFHSDCTVGKFLIVVTNVWAGPNESSPVNATLVLVGVLGKCF